MTVETMLEQLASSWRVSLETTGPSLWTLVIYLRHRNDNPHVYHGGTLHNVVSRAFNGEPPDQRG